LLSKCGQLHLLVLQLDPTTNSSNTKLRANNTLLRIVLFFIFMMKKYSITLFDEWKGKIIVFATFFSFFAHFFNDLLQLGTSLTWFLENF
jgi:hypothetical protein